MTRKPIVTRFHLLLLGLLIGIAATGFFKIHVEAGLPVHWGFDGKPDQIWPRNQALPIFPIAGILVTGLFALIGALVPPEQIDPGRYVSEAILAGVLGLFCAIEFGLLLIGIGSEIDMVRIICFGMAALMVGLGLSLPTSRPNAYSGVRLPWTMRNAANWKATHRLTGILFLIGGIGLGVITYLGPDPRQLLAALFLALLLPLIIGGVVSLALSLGRQR